MNILNKIKNWFKCKLYNNNYLQKNKKYVSKNATFDNQNIDESREDKNKEETDVKIYQIIYNQFDNIINLGPSLVVLGIKIPSQNLKDKIDGWIEFTTELVNLGLFKNNSSELINIYEITDNILGNRGISATVLEFSEDSQLNESMREEKNNNYIKWPDEFKRDCRHWFISGKN